MLNVFVLSTGRCGSVTFSRACEHLDNYTVGHESRAHLFGADRFGFAADHIEVDNRLSWFLGGLGAQFDARPSFYVHLRREPEATAGSYLRRWDSPYPASIIRAYRQGILMRGKEWPVEERLDVCRSYVTAVTANIEEFLRHRPSMTIWLEDVSSTFPAFLDRIGATGDLSAAQQEWRIAHNAS